MQIFSRRNFCALGAGTVLSAWTRLGNAETLEHGSFSNPILPGDHPDPSPIRVGNDYYLTHSSFQYTPGLIIWHSRDLVNWKPVAAALHRYIGDVWAPYLCQHGERFFIYFPVNGGLYVTYADAPLGPWSEPIDLHLRAIDPAHLATANGRRYLYVAGGQMIELSTDGLSTKGLLKKTFHAWPIPDDWRVACECLEGPKVFQRGGYIYLTVAEGGTAGPPTSHMVISMRSKNPEGPWEFSPFNPILHTTSSEQYWWCVGHGRPFEATDGRWWMTCHAYENNYVSLGRQNLLVPLEWTSDGWFRAAADISKNAPIPIPTPSPQKRFEPSVGFPKELFGLEWQFFKGFDPNRISLESDRLTLAPSGSSWADTSAMTCISGDRSYTLQVELEIEPGAEAGLLLFYTPEHSAGINIGPDGLGWVRNGAAHKLDIPVRRATLRLVNDQQEVDCYYKLPGMRWSHLRASFDVHCYNHDAFGGFLALRPALYVAGTGRATFSSFRYISTVVKPESTLDF